jgi:hypothetical protein
MFVGPCRRKLISACFSSPSGASHQLFSRSVRTSVRNLSNSFHPPKPNCVASLRPLDGSTVRTGPILSRIRGFARDSPSEVQNNVRNPDSSPKPEVPPKPTRVESQVPESEPSQKEQRRRDWAVMKKLLVNVWPKNDWRTRGAVVLGFVFLIAGKLLNVQVPFIFKNIIDALNIQMTPDSTVWIIAGSLILGYGAARIGATISGELLNAIFADIGQKAIRSVARETFEHLLTLNLRFHLSRQTGGLTRAIDRGTKYAQTPCVHLDSC